MSRVVRVRTLSGKVIEKDIAAPIGSYEEAILGALQHRRLYGGTVAGRVVARRRAANKAARVSRRVNRARR